MSRKNLIHLFKLYGKFIVIGIFLVLLAFLYLEEKRSLNQEKVGLLKAIKRYKRYLEKNKDLRVKEKEILEAVKRLEDNSIKGETEAIALTKLQNILSQKAEQSNLEVNFMGNLRSARINKEWSVIAVRLNFSGQGKDFLTFLYLLESSERPYIFVDELDISLVSLYKKGLKIQKIRGFVVAKSFWFHPGS